MPLQHPYPTECSDAIVRQVHKRDSTVSLVATEQILVREDAETVASDHDVAEVGVDFWENVVEELRRSALSQILALDSRLIATAAGEA